MKKTFLLCLLLLILSVDGKAQSIQNIKPQPSGDFLIVRTFEAMKGNAYKSFILISDGINELRTVELEDINIKISGKNIEIIVQTLNNIKNEGYILVNSNGMGATSQGIFVTNYIFQKE